MNGMEIMLKSMGIDPKQISETMQALYSLANSVDARLSAIENRLTAIEAHLGISEPEAIPGITQTDEA